MKISISAIGRLRKSPEKELIDDYLSRFSKLAKPFGLSLNPIIEIEDKTFLHKNHIGQEEGKFHLKIKIQSNKLKKLNKIESNKKIFKILDLELKKYIHSIQILIS